MAWFARCARFHFHSSTAQKRYGTMNSVIRLTGSRNRDALCKMTSRLTEQRQAANHTAEFYFFEGDPKRILLYQAEAWDAGCIFIGARGLNHGNRWLLGSATSAVASRAHCSVEIMRG
jgi:nucleotide-binding universal stress UspA family protein